MGGNVVDGGSGPDVSGLPTTLVHSLIGDNRGVRGTVVRESQTPDSNGNLVGSFTASGVIDPLLGPLADNGGPTFTHALLPGSPAIDMGSNPDNLEFDQRGEPYVRVFGDAPDMGAFEVQPDAALPGDANRDGLFNVDDLLLLLAGQKFNTGEAATWEQGDWSGDGLFNIDDLLLALAADNFNKGNAATEADTTNAIDHYHHQEETLSNQPLEVEHDRIASRTLLATQRRSRLSES